MTLSVHDVGLALRLMLVARGTPVACGPPVTTGPMPASTPPGSRRQRRWRRARRKYPSADDANATGLALVARGRRPAAADRPLRSPEDEDMVNKLGKVVRD